MRLRSFHANTMSEAMRLVRRSLGDDAVIVATREEEGGVRVTAALEDDIPVPVQTGSRMIGSSPRPPPEPSFDVGEAVAEVLQRHGVPAALVDRILDALMEVDTDDPVNALSAALDELFTFKPIPEGNSPKPLMLVGPPGAGKTLTAAKLAARAVFKNRSIGVITTDTVRAGGVDQLAAFTRLLKIKLMTVEDSAALPDAVAVQAKVDQLIIDTAGRNPFDPDEIEELAETIRQTDAEPVLVLPAGMDAAEAADIGFVFRGIGAKRMIVTRLDTTRRLGSLLALAHHTSLSFSDISATSTVANGLTALSPMGLARLLIPESTERAPRRMRQTGTHS